MRRSPDHPGRLDPVLAAHLLACPPCRDTDAALADVPVGAELDPPARLWVNITRDVHRGRRRTSRRTRLRARLRPRR